MNYKMKDKTGDPPEWVSKLICLKKRKQKEEQMEVAPPHLEAKKQPITNEKRSEC